MDFHFSPPQIRNVFNGSLLNAGICLANLLSKELKLNKFMLNMRKFSPIFSKYFCGMKGCQNLQ